MKFFETYSCWIITSGLLATPMVVEVCAGENEPLPVETDDLQGIVVSPTEFQLNGVRERLHLLVTGILENGEKQDLTHIAQFTSSAPEVAVVVNGIVQPRTDGTVTITVVVSGKQAQAKISVTGQTDPQLTSFQYDTLPALSKQGCNAGACHGSPSGKGGFRLSLRAFDAQLDKLTLIREAYGRRTNRFDPAQSLLLLKPTMKVAHGGGLQLHPQDPAYQVLHDWIAEGCQTDRQDAPRCLGIEVLPSTGRVLKQPAHTQTLCILAKFSDGSIRDVTEMAVYSSSDSEVATVSERGLVVGHDRGEAAILVRYLEFIESISLTFVKEIEGYEWNEPPADNYIDELIHAKLKQLRYLPSNLCSDEAFIRRATLDVTGVLPTVDEVELFLLDPSQGKRRALVDRLLESPEYAKFWALRWGDLLKMTRDQLGVEGVHKYHRWVQRALQANMPYDEFVRQLLSASGSTLVNPAANFYRAAGDMNQCVETISQVFLGARLTCAKCHNHPFERWTQDNYYGLGAFFNRIQRKKTQRAGELFIWTAPTGEVTQPRTGQTMLPWLPNLGELEGEVDEAKENIAPLDRRTPFVEWLTRPDNPFFAKMAVNRIWSYLLGRGIVDPPDDFRESNPPSNAALLDALAKDFVANHFDNKHMIRTILNSRTYQASVRSNRFNHDDSKYFSHRWPKLLGAEQLLDAICYVTDIPTHFSAFPPDTKATQLPAPDLVNHAFLKAMGQPGRQTVCQCERSGASNLGMAIQLLNGELIYDKIRDANNRFRKLLESGKTNEQILSNLHLAAFSRHPSKEELHSSLKHIAAKEVEVSKLNRQLDAQIKQIDASIETLRADTRTKLLDNRLEMVPEPIRADVKIALALSIEQRDEVQKYLVEKLGPSIQLNDQQVEEQLSKETKKSITEMKSKRTELTKRKLPEGPQVGLEDICWVLLNRNEFLFNH